MALLDRVRQFFRAPERRNPENPSHPLSDPDDDFADALTGASIAGVRVNRETALRFSAVFRAVNLLSVDVAKLPLYIYRREGEGKVRAPEHPAFRLIRKKPNRAQHSFNWRRAQISQKLLQGNAYSLIDRDPRGRPRELLPLDPADTWPETQGGKLRYRTLRGGRETFLPAEQVLHFRGLGDDLKGKSVIGYARESIGLALAAQRYAAGFYERGARPGVVLEHPGKLKPEAKANIRDSWEAIHGGVERSHRLAVLEEGMKLHDYHAMSQEDAQFIATWAQNIREIANWYGVPPHKLGDTTRTSYASLEQENQAYLDDSLEAHLSEWEAECQDKLLSEEEQDRDTHVIEFLRIAVVRANHRDRAALYQSGLAWGWLSRDEVRSRENLNPLPAGEGKKYYVPLNVSLAGEEPPELEPEPDPEPAGGPGRGERVDIGARAMPEGGPPEKNPQENREAATLLLQQLAQRMARRIATHARRAARTPEELRAFLQTRLTDHLAPVAQAAEPALRAAEALGALGRLPELNAHHGTGYAEMLAGATRHLLEPILALDPPDFARAAPAATERLEAALTAHMIP